MSVIADRVSRPTQRVVSPLLSLLFALAICGGSSAPASGADACPNASFRTGPSAALPDCRAYELVTPDSNHVSLGNPGNTPGARVAADGETIVYKTLDAPEHAQSATEQNFVRATRDPIQGWSGVSLSPPLPGPTSSYLGVVSYGVAADLTSTFVLSDQPLGDANDPSGQNAFVRRPDGTYRAATLVGAPFDSVFAIYGLTSFAGGTPDYSHVYFRPYSPQRPSDPVLQNNTYVWSEDKGVRLVGILPDGTPAPQGAVLASYGLPAFSSDGNEVAFTADGRLYVRSDDAQTVEASASRRTVDPDLNPPRHFPVGLTADGKKFLFLSSSELTNDANTGRSGGVATDAGRDLYSYDTVTHELTDLTADHNPADAATGANVQLVPFTEPNSHPIVGATADGSYIYFTATGALADGATSGRPSLYVWHDGQISFVARADGLAVDDSRLPFNIAADGKHVVFASRDNLTGYDNTDPVTGQPHTEIFKATFGQGLECVSCRQDGSRPTGDSSMPSARVGPIRIVSDDGRRVFFHSTDALVPHATPGLQVVYEHADGKIAAVSPLDGPASADPTQLATFLDASATGDNVFIETYGTLVPSATGGDDAVYDVRVGGGFPLTSRQRCSGLACQGSATPAPTLPSADATVAFSVGDRTHDATVTPTRPKVIVSKVDVVRGAVATLKVKVSGPGRLSIAGSGLRGTRATPTKAQTITVRVSLTRKATATLRRHRSFKTRATVQFAASKGPTSKAMITLTFRSRSKSTGR